MVAPAATAATDSYPEPSTLKLDLYTWRTHTCSAVRFPSPQFGAGVVAIVWWLRPEVYDYSHVLENSLLFFEAQRSGENPAVACHVSGVGNAGRHCVQRQKLET